MRGRSSNTNQNTRLDERGNHAQGGDYDEGKKTALQPLAVATDFEIWDSDESSHDHDDLLEFMKQRQEILDLLSSSFDEWNVKCSKLLRSAGLPPIDAADFSFWAFRFCLADSDVMSRQDWLACNNNQDRLKYVQDFLQFTLKLEQNARQKQR
jgi:hypothetical protein